MFIEKENHFLIEELKKHGIIAAYTKKNAGNMSDYCQPKIMQVDDEKSENNEFETDNDIDLTNQKKNRERMLDILKLKEQKTVMALQTHSTNILVIDEETNIENLENIDGFITKRKDVVLFAFYADCLPIFIFDKKQEIIGLLHSGWKGTFDGILVKALTILKEEFQSEMSDIILAMGINIAKDNYEVDKNFYEKFLEKFGETSIVEDSFKYSSERDKYYFDNMRFNEQIALDHGVRTENIILSPENTWNQRFHSHRRDKEYSGRAAGIMSFKSF